MFPLTKAVLSLTKNVDPTPEIIIAWKSEVDATI